MLELLQISRDPALARRCDALPGMRLFVDLERNGKAERQAGRNTFISSHEIDDVARIRDVLSRTPLMVRVNPLHPGSAQEVEQVIAGGADLIMLPMFTSAAELAAFAALVDGRRPIVPLLENEGALTTLEQWVATPGLFEVFVGLNDLHLSLRCRFMFEPLADGLIDPVARAVARQGLRFGLGGIARIDEGQLSGRDVLAEHLRLGSSAVILSRTFHRAGAVDDFEQAVLRLREAEAELATRSPQAVEDDRLRIAARIHDIAATLPPFAAPGRRPAA